MERIKSLDGIRAVAVFLVLLFHVGLFPAGWVGVQVFFVLSGYLISDILLRERELPFPEYLVRFYWRRSLRILPLYLFFCQQLPSCIYQMALRNRCPTIRRTY
jgi:peptidoglycan/LPS O-acetylase OafA/YrhL